MKMPPHCDFVEVVEISKEASYTNYLSHMDPPRIAWINEKYTVHCRATFDKGRNQNHA